MSRFTTRAGIVPRNWNRIRRRALTVCSVLVIAALGAGCQHRQTAPETAPAAGEESQTLTLKRLVVLPAANMFATYGAGVSYDCPFCRRSFIVGDVASGAEQFLTDEIYSRVRERTGAEVVSPEQALGVQSRILFNSRQELSESQLVMETGRELEAEALLLTRVYRFVQLVGGPLSAKSPASVSLSLLLVKADDGTLLWEGHFTETQRPLSDDLFDFKRFFQRQMKWLTAEELAVAGIEEILDNFPVQ